MRAVDTNVLVRLLTRDDPKPLKVAEEFVSAGAWVSHLVLAETVWVLAAVYELQAPELATAVDMLLNQQSLGPRARGGFRGTEALSHKALRGVFRLPRAGDCSQGRSPPSKYFRSRPRDLAKFLRCRAAVSHGAGDALAGKIRLDA